MDLGVALAGWGDCKIEQDSTWLRRVAAGITTVEIYRQGRDTKTIHIPSFLCKQMGVSSKIACLLERLVKIG